MTAPKRLFRALAAAALAAPLLAAAGCSNSMPEAAVSAPRLLGGKPLPAGFASPDGMTLAPDGAIYVSINQVAGKWASPAKIARIGADDKISEFCVLPVDPKSGKASPMGLAFAKDGNLYVSDNQSFLTDEPARSGVVRVTVKDGKPVAGARVVNGMHKANGLTQRGNFIYVAETDLRAKGQYVSGVYRFALDELRPDRPLTVTGIGDPHLVLTFETKNEKVRGGANGLGFDSAGNLYVNNFADCEVLRYTFDAAGKASEPELFAKPEGALSVDGLQVDADDNLWIADIRGNAVFVVSTVTGKSVKIAASPAGAEGADGELDTPSECIRRGSKVYVSNIDLSIGENKTDAIQTISVIRLKK